VERNEIDKVKKEIESLDQRAREHEAWLLDNPSGPRWFARKNEYDDVLFRLASGKMKLAAYESGNIRVPESRPYSRFNSRVFID
jgi:hypothetical protein